MRIGVIGAGNISVHHLMAWTQCAGASVVAICDPDEGRARSRAAEFGIEKTFRDVEAMLASASLDALDILTPRETHAALVRRAAEAGLPTLCQKPLTDGLVQSEALVREVTGRIRLMVNENTRFRRIFGGSGAGLRTEGLAASARSATAFSIPATCRKPRAPFLRPSIASPSSAVKNAC